MGTLDEALACFRRARDLARSHEDTAGELLSLGHLALTLTLVGGGGAVGVPEEAVAETRESVERVVRLQQAYDDPRNRCIAQHVLGVLAHTSGAFVEAADHFADARRAAAEIGDAERSRLAKCSMAVAVAQERIRRGGLAAEADWSVRTARSGDLDAVITRSVARVTGDAADTAPRPVVMAATTATPS
jgi:hypothetical protein